MICARSLEVALRKRRRSRRSFGLSSRAPRAGRYVKERGHPNSDRRGARKPSALDALFAPATRRLDGEGSRGNPSPRAVSR
jgi:hypothetical protein